MEKSTKTAKDFKQIRKRLREVEAEERRIEEKRAEVLATLNTVLGEWIPEVLAGWSPRVGEEAIHVNLSSSKPRVSTIKAMAPWGAVLRFELSSHSSLTVDPNRRRNADDIPECVLPVAVWEELRKMWK